MTLGAVLVAAGDGTRLDAGRPKALVPLDGRPLVAHAVERLVTAGVATLVVVAHPDHLDETRDAADSDVTVVAGGSSRSASVRHGLAALPGEVTVVAVHDAARALTPVPVIAAASAAIQGDVVAAAPGLPVTDTLKRLDTAGRLTTVARDGLVAIQTPQVFRRDALETAHRAGQDATDDLALVEELLETGRLAGRIVVTDGSPLAMKITYRQDLLVAEALLAAQGGVTP